MVGAQYAFLNSTYRKVLCTLYVRVHLREVLDLKSAQKNVGAGPTLSVVGRKMAVIILAAVLAAALGIATAVYAKAAPTCDGGTWTNVSWKSDSPNVQNGVYQGPGGHAELQFD